jgi:RimJ/RimL family protein N-acetyltransferase
VAIGRIQDVPDALTLPDPPLSDGHVTLRPWAAGDVPELLAAAGDELVHRYRYSLPADAAQASEWLAAVQRDRLAGVRLELAVTVDDEMTAVGSVSLRGFHPRNRSGTVSYWLGPDGRGRGAARGAVRLLCAWAFAEVGLARLSLVIEVENRASQRVAEHCGFRREGRQRSHQQLRDGERADVFVYGLLEGELR